jgi:hypothetical protein
MNMNEFNANAVRTEDAEHVYFDVRPFGEKQAEAIDSYLHASLMSIQIGVSSFGSRVIVLLHDAKRGPLSPMAETWTASLEAHGVIVETMSV